MDGCDFAELQRVDEQTRVAMRREPHAVLLKRRLVPVATAAGMSADVEHCRKLRARLCVLRQVKIPGDVEVRPALEVQFLDAKTFLALEDARDDRLQRSALRERP